MNIDGIKIQCRCGKEQCEGDKLTQLHLYAQTGSDVELLEWLLDWFSQNAEEPITETAFKINLEEVRKARAEAKAKADAARFN
jgi:hypothetical protein